MPDFPLPANAPSACPGCGGPWTYGYITTKNPDRLGTGYGNKIYRWALECRNDGCGLGYFVGSEISPKERKGLKLFDRGSRKKEVFHTKGETVPEESPRTVAWSRHYDKCRGCGTTDRKHKSHGLCAKCYTDHKRAGTLDQFRTEKTMRTGGSRKKPAGTAATSSKSRFPCTVTLPENLYRTLEKIGRVTNTPVDDVVVLTIQNYFADIGISTEPASGR